MMTFHATLNQPTKNNHFLSRLDTYPTCLLTGIKFCFIFSKHMFRSTSLLYGFFWFFLASGFDDSLSFIKLSIPVTGAPPILPVPRLRLFSISLQGSHIWCVLQAEVPATALQEAQKLWWMQYRRTPVILKLIPGNKFIWPKHQPQKN